MAYTAPYIDETGLHLPSYTDIRDELNNRTRQIFGQDIYLEVDSLDYQHNSVFSMFNADCCSALEAIYYSLSPKYAVGTSLDNIIKLNGLKRKQASYSTVVLKLRGNIGSVINLNGVRWLLDNKKVIFTEETMTVSATCEKLGAIEAPANSITNIITPTRGWLSCTNTERAVVGSAVETDLELRTRQSKSTELPSVNMIGSLYSALMSLNNVKTCQVYENDTNFTDDNGIPPHSVACVVEGGNITEIGEIISQKKGPGCGTYGDLTVPVMQLTGLTMDIKFFRPVEVPVYLQIPIIPSSLFTTETGDKIKNTIKDFFENIKIGMDITRGSIMTVLSKMIDDVYNPAFKVDLPILTAREDYELADMDTDILFNEKATYGDVSLIVYGA